MGLWILGPKSGEPVPGTVHLQEEASRQIRNNTNVKRGKGRHADIILAPQPSDSPNDPLSKSYDPPPALPSENYALTT